MAAPSVTYTFTNGAASDAGQVNQNFTDIINGITDGTKDLTVNQITADLVGTLQTAAQANVTSLGTLTGLTLNGALSFGSSGYMEYASMYDHEFTRTVTISIANTYVKLTTLSAGLLSTGAAVSSSAIKVPTGVYKVDYSITVNCGLDVASIASAVFLNGVEQEATGSRVDTRAIEDFLCCSGHGFIDVTDADHEVDIRIKNISTTDDLRTTDVCFSMVRVAGT